MSVAKPHQARPKMPAEQRKTAFTKSVKKYTYTDAQNYIETLNTSPANSYDCNNYLFPLPEGLVEGAAIYTDKGYAAR